MNKKMTVGTTEVPIVIEEKETSSGRSVLYCSATVDGHTISSPMTIGTEVDMTQESLQKALDDHCSKLATEAHRRANIKALIKNLT